MLGSCGRGRVRYMAMCLLRNPRPPRPSYTCPFGCPWHEQITCPTVNCMAREPGTYHHMAHQSCYSVRPQRHLFAL